MDDTLLNLTEHSSSRLDPGNIPATSVLVTGASGLVGSHLLKKLLCEGKKIKAIYRKDIPDVKGKENIEWVEGDILDVISLEKAMKHVDHVYHCAAVVSFNPAMKDLMFKTNIEGTANIVNIALETGVKKLCFVSSVAALGKTTPGKEVTESSIWSEDANNSNYGKSKYLAEVEVWRGVAEGLEAVIVNPVIILGSGNWDEGSTKLFKSVYEEFPWYTEGVNGFVDAMDVASAMFQLMESKISGERFILSSEDITYKELFTTIANNFHKKPPTKKVTPLIANIVWRLEAIKSLFTKKQPLVTKETAKSAQSFVYHYNSKIKSFLPDFKYTPIEVTIKRVCNELKSIYHLKS